MQRGLDREQIVTSTCVTAGMSGPGRSRGVGTGLCWKPQPCSRAVSVLGADGSCCEGILWIAQWLAVPLVSTHWVPVAPTLPSPRAVTITDVASRCPGAPA